jgi:ER membrane protein complex subunit 3
MTLLLDPDIRDWVVLPLFVIMIAAGLLRHSVGALLQGDKTKCAVIPQRAQHLLMHTTRIARSGSAHYMPTWKWHARRQHYVALLKEEADWCEEEQSKLEESADDDPAMALMNNPLGMLKGNMAFMIQK